MFKNCYDIGEEVYFHCEEIRNKVAAQRLKQKIDSPCFFCTIIRRVRKLRKRKEGKNE